MNPTPSIHPPLMPSSGDVQRELEAMRKTVAVLTEALEQQQASGSAGGAFALFRQSAQLQTLVEEKTRALARMVEELGATQTQLVHAQKLEAVGQLAAGVAHEINTPLQYIGDNLQFLDKAFNRIVTLLDRVVEAAEECDPDEFAEVVQKAMKKARIDFVRKRVPRALEQSIEGVQNVSHIVAAMKAFSHPGGDEKQPTNLNRLLDTTRTVSRNEWKYVAELLLDLDNGLPPIEGLPSELNQVFLNLIVNAAHAISDRHGTSGEGKIVVRTRAEGDHAIVEIRDNGGGIPEEIRSRIFDPFFTTKEVGRGTGQGLAIARSIVVDKHGGEIEVDTVVGEGTTFRIKLPLSSPNESATESER